MASRGLWLRLIASSGTKLVAHFGYNSERLHKGPPALGGGKWDAAIDLSEHLVTDVSESVRLFQPSRRR